jgi:hypothetical protein
MNDMSQPAPLFQVRFNTETVPTSMFGNVSVSELPSRLLAHLYEEHNPETDSEGFGFALLCETVTGEQGERFTRAILESLPNRGLADMRKMMQAAVRMNGMNVEEVGKDSPHP